jgi:hypothetical protein
MKNAIVCRSSLENARYFDLTLIEKIISMLINRSGMAFVTGGEYLEIRNFRRENLPMISSLLTVCFEFKIKFE